MQYTYARLREELLKSCMLYAYVKNLVELVELHHTLTSWLCLCLARKLEIAWDPLPLQEVRAGVQVSS